MFGVKFGNKHSYDDFNVYLKEKDIGFPDVKRETVEIEGRDGCTKWKVSVRLCSTTV